MNSSFKCLILILLIKVFISAESTGQPVVFSKKFHDGRQKILVNSGWEFLPNNDEEEWISVNLPHTWNNLDPFDDEEGYHRGEHWYRKTLKLNDEWQSRKLFLHFEGANQVASVYINGKFIGEHIGGYSAFTLEITDHVDWASSENMIAVSVDNSHNPEIPPLSVGYALYGGIYRDVYLLVTDPVHFDLNDHASQGFYISTPGLGHKNSEIHINGTVCNGGEPDDFLVKAIIRDADGKEVLRQGSQLELDTGRNQFRLIFDKLKNPHLWSPEDPYLYSLELSIHINGLVRDKVAADFGLRYFSFHPTKGFSLNGMPYKIKGTNRHQDYKNLGSALSNEIHYDDLKNIKEMGCNFVRLAHYPQDPAVLEAADKLGLLVWEEIPLVNYITETEDFSNNCVRMIKEMIRQHFNHPSVIIWGSMNEILLWSKDGERIRKHEDIAYLQNVRKLASKLDETIRQEDPHRYSAMAIHSSNDYFINDIAQIPMILGFNLYHGWYSGKFGGFSNQLLKIHNRNPELIIFMSEYGAGSDQHLESSNPERFDFTGRYQILYHESHLKQINKLDFLGGTAIWNQFDFSQPQIGGSIPHLNQKGMVSWDRKNKDAYYFYRSNWNHEPQTYIASRDWQKRIGLSDDTAKQILTRGITVYSNSGPVELFQDGISMGVQTPDEISKTSWMIPLHQGMNQLKAISFENSLSGDSLQISCKIFPQDFSNLLDTLTYLRINVGSNAQYLDSNEKLWMEDKPYNPGNYGYLDGTRKVADRHLVITHTNNEPLYYSYLDGVSAYRIDLPGGRYMIELHFLEAEYMKDETRQFHIKINNKIRSRDFSLAGNTESSRAVTTSFEVSITGNEGLTLSFESIKGKPVLHGISINKISP